MQVGDANPKNPMATQDKVILLDPYPRTIDSLFNARDKTRLEKLGHVIWHDGSPASAEHIERYMPDTIALLGQTAMPRERLDRAPNLRLIANVESNFLPNVDYAECVRRGIYVISTGPVFAQPVAEMALGYALAAARRMTQADAAIRTGNESLYGVGDNTDSFLLHGKTLGLLGCGNLGRALLPLLRPFSQDILVHDPWLHDSVLREMDVEPVGFDDLFRRSKVVFVLTAVTSENQGFIGAKQFGLMQPGSVFVLASRAAVVNYDDMLDAAERGHIRVAADVFPVEPIPKGHRARRTPNTVLGAHRAGNVPEIWTKMGEMVTDDLELILRGLPPQRCQRANVETVARIRSMPAQSLDHK